MWRVLFFCPSMPAQGWQGKGQYPNQETAMQWAYVLKEGTRGTAVVLDPWGFEVYRIG
jgi:hypothetical protein